MRSTNEKFDTSLLHRALESLEVAYQHSVWRRYPSVLIQLTMFDCPWCTVSDRLTVEVLLQIIYLHSHIDAWDDTRGNTP